MKCLSMLAVATLIISCGGNLETTNRNTKQTNVKKNESIKIENFSNHRFVGMYQAGCESAEHIEVKAKSVSELTQLTAICLLPNFKDIPTGLRFELQDTTEGSQKVIGRWFTTSKSINCSDNSCEGEDDIVNFDPNIHGSWGSRVAQQ